MLDGRIKKYNAISIIVNSLIVLLYVAIIIYFINVNVKLSEATPKEGDDIHYFVSIISFIKVMDFIVIIGYSFFALIFIIALIIHKYKGTIYYIIIIDAIFAYDSLVFLLSGIDAKSLYNIIIFIISIGLASCNLFVQIKRYKLFKEKEKLENSNN